MTIVEVIWPHDTIAGLSAISHAGFYFYTAYALIRSMFADHEISRDEVWATGATFTVVAWGFAYVYIATQLVWPNAFNAAVDAQNAKTWNDMLFLSVTTLTNTGLSDIVPVLPQARSIVMLEEIAGMLYLALVVARIMTLLTARATRASVAQEQAILEASTWEPAAAEQVDEQANEQADEQVGDHGDQHAGRPEDPV